MDILDNYIIAQSKSKIKAGEGKNKGKYKFFNSSNVQTKFYDEYQYDKPALIFGTGGNASIHYCDEPFSTSTDCIVFYARSESVDLKLIYIFISSNMHLLESGFKGIGIKHISKSYIQNIEIKIPGKEVQSTITKSYDQICDLISRRKEQLSKLDELVKARFVELFGDPVANEKGWETLSLEQACNSIVDCPHSTPNYTFENTGYMCIRTSIVKKNKLLWDKIEYISEEEYNKRIQRKKPEKGDVVYTREGAILGIAAIIDRDCNVALGQRSMLLSPNKNKCVSEFVCVAMNFESFLDNALKGISGSASPHINVGDIKSFNMIMPPMELQNQFAAFVEQTDKSKLEVQKSLEKLELLKKALMQKYFG